MSRRPQFYFLHSPGLVDRNKIPVPAFKPTQLLDELVDPVVARQRASVVLDHRDCDRFLSFAVEFVRVFLVVSALCCRGVDRNFSVSFTLVRQSWLLSL